uniref:Alpha-keratin n=1 Tax=Apalone spinifera TaxID=55534 RepID=A0A0B6VUH1_APASP|nr:alpha-keratin [Apalone spinifera]
MQNLNDRLASYLEKVRDLEESNADLEKLIKEWYTKQGPAASLKDYSPYLKEIDDIGKEIVVASVECNKVAVDVDNTKMTIDDFRTKAEHEMALRQNVEADINGLRPLLDQLTISKSDLEMEYETLKEELISLMKNHEEEIKGLITQTTGDVNVEVNAAPGYDLTEALDDMRKEYDAIIERNRKEVEQWYAAKIAEVNQEVSTSGQDIEINSKQITELRREYQNVEIELQSQLSMLQSLQSSLDDTECRYNMQLQQMQSVIGSVEEELANIRCEIENQSQEYKLLLGIKMQLEQEIAQYRSLLDSGSKDISVAEGVRGGVSRGGGNRVGAGSVPTLPRGGDGVRAGGGGGVRVGGESNRTEGGGSVVRGEGSTGGRGEERRSSKSNESFAYSRRNYE